MSDWFDDGTIDWPDRLPEPTGPSVTVRATALPCVAAVLPSYYFAPYADVYVLTCGHRQLRAHGTAAVGEFMHCGYCES